MRIFFCSWLSSVDKNDFTKPYASGLILTTFFFLVTNSVII